MTDFYSTLGVDRSADPDTIKHAYRRLAAQHHPDRGGDKNKFQEIQAAYDTLSDPEKKAEYDNPQPQGFHFHFGQGGGGFGGFPGGFGGIFEQHFGPGHPFGDMFGGRAPARNRTLNLQTTISLEDAYLGKDLLADVILPSGKKQSLNVKIPPGVDEGTVIRLSGIGDDSIPNLPRGDIHLTIHLEPHFVYRRQGDDLIRVIDISCIDAMLGKELSLDTLGGSTLSISIKPGTQPGQLLSIPGYGMPSIQNKEMKGRLLLEVKVTIPTFLSEYNKKLLNQLKL